MTCLKEYEFTQAKKILTNMDEITDPTQRIPAFKEFEIEDSVGQILSKRKGASLEIFIHSPCALKCDQSDQFDTQYNEGVPIHLQRDVPNQWHLIVETQVKHQTLRIGAIMGVRGPGDFFELEVIQDSDGWLGALREVHSAKWKVGSNYNPTPLPQKTMEILLLKEKHFFWKNS